MNRHLAILLTALVPLAAAATAAPETGEATRVDIDVKPRSDPSSFNCKATKEEIPVAVLSSATFDATTLDASSVLFGKSGSEAAEIHLDKTGEAKRHISDANEDGLPDLVFHFRFGDTGFSCADIPPGAKSHTLTAVLTGAAYGNAIISEGDLCLVRE